MDDVKKYRKVLQKHHFWVLAVLVLIVGPLCWRAGASYLTEQAASNKATIDGKFNAVQSIVGNPPNASFAEEVGKLEGELKQQVLAAWELLYKDQAPLFKWPAAVKSIELLRPATAEAPAEEIPEPIRIQYQQFVMPAEWQRIFLKANYLREKPIDPTAVFSNPEVQYEGLVEWSDGQRGLIVSRYQSATTLTDLSVRLTQEDLWIYENLVEIIAKMNEGVTDPHNAIVKRIDMMEIGGFAMENAKREPGLVTTFTAPSAGTYVEGAMPVEAFPVPLDAGYIAPTAVEGAPLIPLIAAGRYLGAAGERLDATAPLPYAEFKHLFVDLRVTMDQRRIPEFLTLCANAPFPIEVRQVRIASSSAMAGTAVGTTGLTAVLGPQDAQVEVRGIIYMYNPPNIDRIGQGAAGAPPAQRPMGIPGALY